MDQVPQQMPLLIEDLDDAMREAIRALDADRTPRQAQLDFIRRRRRGC